MKNQEDVMLDETLSTLKAVSAKLRARLDFLEKTRVNKSHEINAIRKLPPDRGELKAAFRRVVGAFCDAWNRPMLEQLDRLKSGDTLEHFEQGQSSLAGQDEWIQKNGWTALLGVAMLKSVDEFVESLDWPDGIGNAKREARIAALESELAPIVSEMDSIRERLTSIADGVR